jgi:hypothetical protein
MLHRSAQELLSRLVPQYVHSLIIPGFVAYLCFPRQNRYPKSKTEEGTPDQELVSSSTNVRPNMADIVFTASHRMANAIMTLRLPCNTSAHTSRRCTSGTTKRRECCIRILPASLYVISSSVGISDSSPGLFSLLEYQDYSKHHCKRQVCLILFLRSFSEERRVLVRDSIFRGNLQFTALV